MEIDLVAPKYTALLAGSRVCLVCTLLLGSRFKNCSLCIWTGNLELLKLSTFPVGTSAQLSKVQRENDLGQMTS